MSQTETKMRESFRTCLDALEGVVLAIDASPENTATAKNGLEELVFNWINEVRRDGYDDGYLAGQGVE